MSTTQPDRRQFLRTAVAAAAGGAVLPGLQMAAPAGAQSASPGVGPYGPLATEPDENGLLLPEGFTSRIVAVGGEAVAGTTYVWPAFPDGAATFATPDGGWIHTVNSEVFSFIAADSGGASALRYDKDGVIVDAYSILEGSNSNCSGGPTPWGTWLSCEENIDEKGRVFECDPTGETEAVVHEAMGLFAHEAVAVHEPSETLYLTQDNPTGLLYRYSPDAYPDLASGLLEAATVGADGAVTWSEVTDPSGTTAPTREQVPGATTFPGAEGIWCHEDTIYFTSKGDHSVHAIDVMANTYELIYRGDPAGLGIEGTVLSGVDNITVDAGSGDLFVAEDGANMEVVVITPDGEVAAFARVVGPAHEGSEVTGPCFNPARDRLYFSSQRGPSSVTLGSLLAIDNTSTGLGTTFEVTGPFRGRVGEQEVEPTPAPTTTIAAAVADGGDGEDDGGFDLAPVLAVGVAAAAAGGALIAWRRRTGESSEDGPDSTVEADI